MYVSTCCMYIKRILCKVAYMYVAGLPYIAPKFLIVDILRGLYLKIMISNFR